MIGTANVAGRLGLFALALLLQPLPSFVLAASPLRLECLQEHQVPGRALVCEYSILSYQNTQLADLHDRIIRDGRAARVDVRRWLGQRDACRDVDCLDKVFEGNIQAARIALVDVEARQPAVILVNARGVPVRVLPEAPLVPPNVAPEGERYPSGGAPTFSVREPSRFEQLPFDVLLLLLVAAVVLYTVVAVRISRPDVCAYSGHPDRSVRPIVITCSADRDRSSEQSDDTRLSLVYVLLASG